MQMKKERCEKLGIPFNEAEALKEIQTESVPKQAVQLSKSESVMVQLEQVRVGAMTYPERAKAFFELVVIYLSKNPLIQTTSLRIRLNRSTEELTLPTRCIRTRLLVSSVATRHCRSLALSLRIHSW